MIKKLLIMAGLLVSLGLGTTAQTSALSPLPVTQFAACPESRILTFPTWYHNLQLSSSCSVQLTSLDQLWVIALNVIEIGIQAAGYITVILLIWGGIKYVKSQGDPSQLTESKNTILNAIVGLAVVLSSVAIVEFISGRFSG